MQPNLTQVIEPETLIEYPRSWETEYRDRGRVDAWNRFPELYAPYLSNGSLSLSTRPGTLELFAQYALMYLLREKHGFHSITWYSLAQTSRAIKNIERRDALHTTMQKWMGRDAFERLQAALIASGFRDFNGEPDLFCWHPDTLAWFFAEAKRKDRVTPSSSRWFQTCRDCLGATTDLRVYRLRAAKP
jgi:hypothetical protein